MEHAAAATMPEVERFRHGVMRPSIILNTTQFTPVVETMLRVMLVF
jgi:hypothetical protein